MDKPIPYIGSKISLVSKSEIRYVGTLYNINIEDSTVALQNVKVYGTEGRRKGGLAQIPPNSQIFEYVIFKGSDIKDLDVYNPSKDEQEEPAFQDPAIISSSVSSTTEASKEPAEAAKTSKEIQTPANGSNKPSQQKSGKEANRSNTKPGPTATPAPAPTQGPTPTAVASSVGGEIRRASEEDQGPVATEVYGSHAHGGGQGRSHYQRQDNRQMNYNSNGRRGRGGWHDNRGYNGRRNHNYHNHDHNHNHSHNRNRNYSNYGRGTGAPHMGHRPNTSRVREDYSKEFDFHAMNEQFEKEKEKEMAKLSLEASKSKSTSASASGEDGEEENEEAEQEAPKAYSKSSFFDSISCDITDRQGGNSKGPSKSVERQRNKETFGNTRTDNRYRRRGNHQYHYRGGGRGQGRGGQRYNGRGSRGRGRGRRYNNSYSNEQEKPRDDAVQPAS